MEIANIHKLAFTHSHFTALFSINLLMKYYEAFLNEGSEIWLAQDSNSVTGFVVFGEGMNKKIRGFKSEFMFEIFKTALFNPIKTAKKVLSKVYYGLLAEHYDFDECENLILSIAVKEKGNGIGSELLNHVAVCSEKSRKDKVGLYVRADSVSTINFYLKSGYNLIGYTSGLFYMERSNKY
jgi:ribosomal protein S18 acetylase RimI-like enzyme